MYVIIYFILASVVIGMIGCIFPDPYSEWIEDGELDQRAFEIGVKLRGVSAITLLVSLFILYIAVCNDLV